MLDEFLGGFLSVILIFVLAGIFGSLIFGPIVLVIFTGKIVHLFWYFLTLPILGGTASVINLW